MAKRTPSTILEFVLTQPTPHWFTNALLLTLPVTSPSPRILKLLLLRRLASCLSSISSQTLSTLELIEQLDREHHLTPSPPSSLQLAYSAVAVHLTAKNRNLEDFFDSVNKVWNCRVGDLERSEAKGLVSEGLRAERRLMEEAVVNREVRGDLMRRETGKEAEMAVRVYVKEALEGMGPSSLELEAMAALQAGRGGEYCGREGTDEAGMPIRENVTFNQTGCSTSGFDRLHMSKAIQEKDQLKPRDEKDHNVVEDPLLDVLPEAAGDYLNLKSLEENQTEIDRRHEIPVDKGVGSTCAGDISSSPWQNSVQDTLPQPTLANQNRGLEHGKKTQNVFSSTDLGKATINTEVLTGKKRETHGAQAFSFMDRNPTARTHEWHDDSTDASPEKSPNSSAKIHIPRPMKRAVPVTETPWNRQFAGRRKKKWWSAEEEDTLRKAVEEHGAGNWTSIKNCYPKIFEDRTPTDLKDKWRNMVT